MEKKESNPRRKVYYHLAVLLAAFSVIFLRLWFLQVMAHSHYEKLAEENRLREITVDVLRGEIFDRKGKPLAINQPSIGIYLFLPEAKNEPDMLMRLGKYLKIPLSELKKKLSVAKEGPLKPVLISKDASLEEISYLKENAVDFPYVTVNVYPRRFYPAKATGAPLLGYVGEISEEELKRSFFNGCEPGDMVGKMGLERELDQFLRGEKGRKIVEVDARGKQRRLLSSYPGKPGDNISLTIDIDLQKVCEETLSQAIKMARRKGSKKARAGAAVVINPDNGEVLALASLPTFDPNLFQGKVSSKYWKRITSRESGYPLFNRAYMGAYPPASLFKPFTLLAGLKSGVVSFYSTIECKGRWEGMGKDWPKHCWERSGHGYVSASRAIIESCDSYFYEIGYKLYKKKREEIQSVARLFGYGEKTGIPLPSEFQGRVPDKAWKESYYKKASEKIWLPGDSVNLAIGQGDILATPLQVALSYAALANGGKLYKPQIIKEIERYDGVVIRKFTPVLVRQVSLKKSWLDVIQSYLKEVTTKGTARGAFKGFPVPVAGKTGTAQVYGKEDFAWFVALAPAGNPRYVVVVLIEEGGHGGEIAAPAARRILSYLFDLPMVFPETSDVSR